MDNVLAVADVLLAFALMFVWTILLLFILCSSVLEKSYKNRFFSAVTAVLSNKKFDLNKCTTSIRNSYDVYRSHRFGFPNKKIIPICQELSLNLRNGKGLDSARYPYKDLWADRLDEIIRQLQYEEEFDDEKANEIIEELNGKIGKDIIQKVKQKLIFLEAYHKGVISVKNAEIQELKEKASRDKWIKWITGTLGVVGSVASIISLFVR